VIAKSSPNTTRTKGNKMKTYLVNMSELRTAVIEVEAESEEEARAEASALYFEEKLEFDNTQMGIGDVELSDV